MIPKNQNEKDTQGYRLRLLRQKMNMSIQVVSEKVGLTRQTWYNTEKRLSILSRRNLAKVAELFNVSVTWLETGAGVPTSLDGSTVRDLDAELNQSNQQAVYLIDGAALAGLRGAIEQDTKVEGVIYLPNLKTGATLYAIRVSGRSMEPSIKEGATIILEEMTEPAQFRNGKTYVLIIKGIPFVKQVDMILSGEQQGMFQLSSSNEATQETIGAHEIQRWYSVLYTINPL